MKTRSKIQQKWLASLTLASMILGSLSPLVGASAASVVPGHDISVTASTPTETGSGDFYVTLEGTAGGPGDGQQIFVRVNWGDGTPADESFIPGQYTPLGFIESNVDAWFHGVPYGTQYPFSLNGYDSGDWIGQHTYAADAACVVGGSCTVTAELYYCQTLRPEGVLIMKCGDGPEDDTELLANATTTIIFGEGPPPPPPPVDATINLEKIWVLNDPQSTAPNFSVLFEGAATLPDSDETPLTRTLTRPAGTYSLTEDAITNFATTIACTRNQEVGNIYASGGISVSSGDVVNCTITNDENEPAPVPATLTVEKVWQGTSTTYAVYLGDGQILPEEDGTPSSVTMELAADTYIISEPAIAGYTTQIACSYNNQESAFGNSQNGSYEFTLEAGEDVHCTVTNIENGSEEEVGTLIVRKVVVGSETPASAFTLHVEGNNPSTTTFQGESGYGTYVILEAGSYDVTEDAAPGYTTTYSEDCEGVMEQPEVSLSLISVGTLSTRYCTVTNTLIEGNETQGTLIIKKHVVNDNKGQADANDFLMVVTATNPSTGSFPGNEDGVVITVDPGTYSVDEDSSGAYAKSLGANCSGTIAAGEVKECVITNDDPGSPSTGGGSSGGGSNNNNNNNSGGGGGGGLSAAPGGQATGFDIPAGRVLGIEDVNTAEGACWADEPDARIAVRTLDEILAALGINRNLSSETFFDQTLVPRVTPLELAVEFRNMVKNWTAYGTSGGLRLGAGERAGVVDSYRAVYGHVPRTECEWRDALRIASGKLPSLNQPREQQMLATFKTIYSRDADRTQPRDNAAINIMTYGIRPMVRSLANERAAIRIFHRIFGHNPANATEWDTMRAMANSGLALPQ